MSVAQLEAGFSLDRLFRWMEGLMDGSKRPTLALLAKILADEKLAYAVIGGVALQVHRHEPRTTIDIDLAVVDRADWPARSLEAAGFRRTGAFEHSEKWISADGTPVQITDDPAFAACVARAGVIEIDGLPLPILAPLDLLRAIGAQDKFDDTALDFAAHFGRSAPQWALESQAGGAPAEVSQAVVPAPGPAQGVGGVGLPRLDQPTGRGQPGQDAAYRPGGHPAVGRHFQAVPGAPRLIEQDAQD